MRFDVNHSVRTAAGTALIVVLVAACSSTPGTPSADPSTAVAPSTIPATTQATPSPQPSPPPQASPAPAAYGTTSVQVTGSTDRASYDVALPQITGGNRAVTNEFNSSMRAALQDQINGFQDQKFTLETGNTSVIHVGAHVISGIMSTFWDANPPGAHGASLEATITIDADDATPVTLQRVFPNLSAGLQRLSDQAAALLPATSAGAQFERNGIAPTVANFANWVATPAGMEIRFSDYQVGPYAIGLVHITVPWESLQGVIDPTMSAVLSS